MPRGSAEVDWTATSSPTLYALPLGGAAIMTVGLLSGVALPEQFASKRIKTNRADNFRVVCAKRNIGFPQEVVYGDKGYIETAVFTNANCGIIAPDAV